MGYYIQTGTSKNKADCLVERFGAERLIAPPESYDSIPEGKALVVVIDNGAFEAAAFMFSEDEFNRCVLPTASDHRPRTFVIMDKEVAKEESGYNCRV